MAQASETFVRWYLRFNGYLGVENLVVHEPTPGAVPQGAEFDVVAVRFPFSLEIPGFELPRDPRLAEIESQRLINVVIGEVKGGKKPELNDPWRAEADDAVQLRRLKYLVRWIGLYERDEEVEKVAKDLRRAGKSELAHAIRVVYFGARPSKQAADRSIPQILLPDIASWIVNSRAGSWAQQQVATRSAHDQWDELIKNVWNLADPALPGTPEGKIASILALVLGRAVP